MKLQLSQLLFFLLPLLPLPQTVAATDHLDSNANLNDNNKGTQKLSTTRRSSNSAVFSPPDAVRRLSGRASSDHTVNISVYNDLTSYMANISVGNPGQNMQVILDTGSSDLWFPAGSVCQNKSTCPGGSYDPNDSSSYKEVARNEFNITYADGSHTEGDLFTDVLRISGNSLDNFTMAVGNTVTNQEQAQGVFGIGYVADESSPGHHYANFPQALYQQGLIKSVAYSLWLDDLKSSTGTVLFGGVDTSKYTGDLHALDVVPISGNTYSAFNVPIKSLSLDNKEISNHSTTAVLDTGTSFTMIPEDAFRTIASELNVRESLSNYVVPCSERNKDKTFTFSFGKSSQSVDIKVKISEFVLSGSTNRHASECILGFDVSPDNTFTLGDTFLRSVYAVFDLENNQVALAPASFKPGSSHVIPFSSKGAKIPTAKGTGSSSSGGKNSGSNRLGTASGMARQALLGFGFSMLVLFS